jgi:sigma-70-like protein
MELRKLIGAAVEIGERNGAITFDELNELCPSWQATPEEIEQLMQALSDAGIDVVED